MTGVGNEVVKGQFYLFLYGLSDISSPNMK